MSLWKPSRAPRNECSLCVGYRAHTWKPTRRKQEGGSEADNEGVICKQLALFRSWLQLQAHLWLAFTVMAAGQRGKSAHLGTLR